VNVLRKTIRYAILILVVVIMVFPFYWMLITSLKTNSEVLLYLPTFFPRNFTLKYFSAILSDATFPRYLLNSIIVVCISTLISVFLSTIGGYIFAKLGIMMPLFLTSFGIFFIRQNALAIPDDLLDAARIDGAKKCSASCRFWPCFSCCADALCGGLP